MVVKHLQEYMTDNLIDRVEILQTALFQAENIMLVLEKENERLKYALASLASENNEGYVLDSEAFDEPACAVG
jgi:hypothetical protein